MPKSKNLPSIGDWQKLSSVMVMLDWIVDDSYVSAPLIGGLFASLHEVEANGPATVPSKLKNWPSGLPYDSLTELLKALPGIDSIGNSRSERICALHARLPELAAYAWLAKQDEFREACKTVRRTQRPNKTDADCRWLDMRLIRAIQAPVASLHLFKAARYEPAYPEARDLAAAVTRAKVMETFFKQNGGIFLGEHGLSWEVSEAARLIHARLSSYAANYRKPRDDSAILEIQFMESVATFLHKEFGTCSATILERLCVMAGYSPGGLTRKVQEFASTINSTPR